MINMNDCIVMDLEEVKNLDSLIGRIMEHPGIDFLGDEEDIVVELYDRIRRIEERNKQLKEAVKVREVMNKEKKNKGISNSNDIDPFNK